MLVTKNYFDDEPEKMFTQPHRVCFKCGEPIVTTPLIMWHGSGANDNPDIWLHPPCAVHLATHLLLDNNKLLRNRPPGCGEKFGIPEKYFI